MDLPVCVNELSEAIERLINISRRFRRMRSSRQRIRDTDFDINTDDLLITVTSLRRWHGRLISSIERNRSDEAARPQTSEDPDRSEDDDSDNTEYTVDQWRSTPGRSAAEWRAEADSIEAGTRSEPRRPHRATLRELGVEHLAMDVEDIATGNGDVDIFSTDENERRPLYSRGTPTDIIYGTCTICFDNDVSVRILPCRHTLCNICLEECLQHLMPCPFCRRNIEDHEVSHNISQHYIIIV